MINSLSPFAVRTQEAPPRRPVPTLLPDHYEVTRLAEPAPGHGFNPTAVNDDGKIIGNMVKPRRFEGASWSAAGVCIPPLPRSSEQPIWAENAWPFSALSSSGLVAGTVSADVTTRRAWASHRGEFGQEFWPNALSFAQGINASGTVVGKTLITAEPLLISRAFRLTSEGRPKFFHAPEGGFTDAVAINDEGTVLLNVTGLSVNSPRLSAWTWDNDSYVPLETPMQHASLGVALTSDGSVLGYVEPKKGPRSVVLWVRGMMTDLNIPIFRKFRPHAINNDLVAVGSALTNTGQRSACRWSFGRGLEFLETLASSDSQSVFTDAVAINQHGQILVATRDGSHENAGLLTPSA